MSIFQLELTCNVLQRIYDELIDDQAPQNTGSFSGTTIYGLLINTASQLKKQEE